MGAANLQTVKNDEYLWFQNPDTTFSKPAILLVLSVPGNHKANDGRVALTPGQKISIDVKGDDLAKVNSQADATRFGITDPSLIQTPDEFPLVSGAHVVYRAADLTATRAKHVVRRRSARLDVSGLPAGTWYVWAEKPMGDVVYVRSQPLTVNVGVKPAITHVGSKPTQFTKNHALTIQYKLNKAPLRVRWVITSNGRAIAKGQRAHVGSGWQGFTWTGVSKRVGKSLTVSLRAYDNWGRASAVTQLKVRVRR